MGNTGHKSGIFISYRRSDSAHQADRLWVKLADAFGEEAIFMDVDSIPLGSDFRATIEIELGRCGIMLALIGPGWLTASRSGGRRIDAPDDPVATEIRTALESHVVVIPVLLDGVQMPDARGLPSALNGLSYRRAATVRRESFDSDVDHLIRNLYSLMSTLAVSDVQDNMPEDAPEWDGVVVPYRVGDPGRVGMILGIPDQTAWDSRDTVFDGVRIAAGGQQSLQLRAASVRGRAHRHYGRARQDSYSYRVVEDELYLVCAVADGVSTGASSHIAAEIVTSKGCAILSEQLRGVEPPGIEWRILLNTLGNEILRASRRDTVHEAAREMASTALFAIIELQPVLNGQRRLWTFNFGDSAAWILRQESWRPITSSSSGGEQLLALPFVPERLPAPVVSVLEDSDVFILATDGIGDPMGDGATSVGTFLAEKWNDPPHPLAFTAQVDFARRSYDDDRTVVAVWPSSYSSR